MFYFYGLAKGSMIYLSRWHKNTSLRHAVVLSMAPVTDCHRDIHGRPVVPGQMDLLTERYISHPVFVWISTWICVCVCVCKTCTWLFLPCPCAWSRESTCTFKWERVDVKGCLSWSMASVCLPAEFQEPVACICTHTVNDYISFSSLNVKLSAVLVVTVKKNLGKQTWIFQGGKSSHLRRDVRERSPSTTYLLLYSYQIPVNENISTFALSFILKPHFQLPSPRLRPKLIWKKGLFYYWCWFITEWFVPKKLTYKPSVVETALL